MNTIKRARLPKERIHEVRNFSCEKELVDSWDVVVAHKGKLERPVTARAWMGRSKNSSVVYASIWVHGGKSVECSGSGRAGGYGYHKISAALDDAIRSAGVKLVGDDGKQLSIGGVGDSAIRHALEAITRAAGFRGQMVIV